MSYIILSVIVIVISFFYEKAEDKLNRGGKIAFLLFICLFLCGFAGLRSSYNDTKTYIAIFQNTSYSFDSIFSGEFLIGSAYLSKIFNWAIHSISNNYHVYFFMCSVAFVVPAVFAMDKYSISFPFSIFLFMTTGLYLFSLAAVRQSIAIGILILAIDAFIEEKYKKFFLLCLVATSFHLYSILMILLLFLKREKLFGKKMIAMCVAVLLFGVGMTKFSGYLSNMATIMGKDISQEEISTGSVSIFRALVYLAPFGLIFMSRRILNKNYSREQNVFIILSVLSAMLMTLALFGNPILLGRVPYYFVFGTVISLPYIIRKTFTKSSVTLANLIVIVCYCIYEIYELRLDEAFTRDIFNLTWF